MQFIVETPALEKNSTLLGKYGNEGDRLIFKILNSGEKVKKANISAIQANNLSEFTNSISEKGLRYDLTVPLARFVAQHQNDLIFPFKRFKFKMYGELIDLSMVDFRNLLNVMLIL